MQSGKLRDYVTIQTYTPVTAANGSTTKSWSTFGQVYAEIKSVSGREYLQMDDKLQGDVSYKIRIRYLAGVLDKMRVLHGSIVYEIASILPDRTSAKYIYLMCRRKQP